LGSKACLVIWAFDQGVLGISPTFYANIARFLFLDIPFFILAVSFWNAAEFPDDWSILPD